jgi:hypothetical protein
MADVGLDLGIPSAADFSDAARRWGGWAIGMGSPTQQILANLVIFVVAVVSSSVTFGATLIIAALAMFFGFVGIVRLIPVVDKYWPLNQG